MNPASFLNVNAYAVTVGIYASTGAQKVISGREIDELIRVGGTDGKEGSVSALALALEDASVCFRTTPRHKLYIVRALQSKNHVVGMTGDGVNDAPALKQADIGIAVGSGTDVAKEASAMVIVDDDFSTVVTAIEEGKSIFYNIKNFLTFQLSTSVAALALVACMNVIGRPNPLNPMQILWINIIMDGPPAQSLGVETVDGSVMRRAPRRRDEDIITRPLLYRVFTSGLLILFGTIYIFLLEMDDGVVTSRDRTMTFTTFVMFDMMNAITCRHNHKPIWELKWNSNMAFVVAFVLSIVGQLLVIYCPPFQKVFRTVFLSAEDMGLIIALSSTMLVVDSIRKVCFPRVFTEMFTKSYGEESTGDDDEQVLLCLQVVVCDLSIG